jgi:hypothetical protein
MKAAGATEPNYANVDSSQGFWQIESASATINGEKIDRTGNTSIMDTGTTLCLVDDKLVEAVYKAIPGSKYDDNSQGYVFPANTSVDKLPDVTLAIGDTQVAFQKEDLGFADAGNGLVFGSIQSRGTMDMDIYGDAVLKAMYAVSYPAFVSLTRARCTNCMQIFDINNGSPRFGWVQRKESNQNTSAPPSSG